MHAYEKVSIGGNEPIVIAIVVVETDYVLYNTI